MNYVPLYIKTENSLLNSIIKIPELISFAKENNLNALTITDASIFGAIEFYNTCKKNNIKPIIGMEVFLNKQTIVLYAKSFIGYKQILKLATIQSAREITIEDLLQYNSELIVIIPFKVNNLYSSLNSIFSNTFLSYQNSEEYNWLIENNYNQLVYMRETLYLSKSDKEYLRYFKAIGEGKLLSDTTLDGDYDLTLPNELNYEINLNNQIYALCNIEIEVKHDLLPIYPCPEGYSSYQYLRHLCKEGLKKRFGSTVSKRYIERLNYELDVIHKMDFCNYFLVVWDYVKYAKEAGILVGPGRGSAAGSLVSYCLQITDIDPIQYNLLFERFLNPERITMPDIDIDFEASRRNEVVKYCIDKYGDKRVAGIITFGTMGAKQVVRDVGRVMNVTLHQVDYLCKMLDARISLSQNYQKNKLIQEYLQNQELKTMYQVSLKLEGLKRHTSVHAAGVVMSIKDIDETVPLYKYDGMYLTGYSMYYLEDLGLLKMDFLGLTTLETISGIIKQIRNDNIEISFDDIPLDDKKALSVFHEVNTTGIFQFESSGMMEFLRKFKPDNFEDIFAALALYRPGPMQNIGSYIKRKNGQEKIDYLAPDLVPILKPTYGILIYQEQIMQVANIMAGYSLGEADVLRRAMSKKKEDVMLLEKSKFITRAMEKGYSEELSTKVFELILKFASYGFNRSHSVAYAVIAYKMAYLKAHFPLYFMKHLMTTFISSASHTKKYIYECKINHIELLKPHINYSSDTYCIEGSSLRYPLTNIKNVGDAAARIILEERKKGEFTNIYDFVKRVYGRAINKKTLINLVWAGCFDGFQFNQKTIVDNLDLVINYGELLQDLDEEYALEPELELKEEYTKQEIIEHELEIFGFYLSNHPVTEYKLKHPSAVTLEQLGDYFDKPIKTVIYIDNIRTTQTKRNETMCFVSGSDEMIKIDMVLFPKVYQKYSNSLEVGNIALVSGNVEKRFDKLQIIVQSIEILNK